MKLVRKLRDRLREWWHHEPDYTPAGEVILAPEYNERYAGERELQRGADEEEGRQD